MSRILRSRRFKLAACIAAVFNLAFLLFDFAPHQWARVDTGRDIIIYHNAARAALQGQPLYQMPPEFGADKTLFVYIYAPYYAALLAPLGDLSFQVFMRIWLILLMGAFWLYAWFLARLYAKDQRVTLARWLIAALAITLCYGSLRAVALGQVDPVLWAFFGFGMTSILYSRTPRNYMLAGAFWTAAALVKPFLIWPLVAAVAGRTKVKTLGLAAGFAGVTIPALLLGLWICGVDAYSTWIHDVLPVLGQGTLNPDNFSLSMGVLRLARLVGWEYSTGQLPLLARVWLTVASFAGPLVALLLLRGRGKTMRCAVVGVVAAFCAPTCWSSYLPLLLTPLALYVGKWNAAGEIDKADLSCDSYVAASASSSS